MSYYDDQIEKVICDDGTIQFKLSGNNQTDWMDLNAESIECLLAFLSVEGEKHGIKVNYTVL